MGGDRLRKREIERERERRERIRQLGGYQKSKKKTLPSPDDNVENEERTDVRKVMKK